MFSNTQLFSYCMFFILKFSVFILDNEAKNISAQTNLRHEATFKDLK